jgi:hypothetical protein
VNPAFPNNNRQSAATPGPYTSMMSQTNTSGYSTSFLSQHNNNSSNTVLLPPTRQPANVRVVGGNWPGQQQAQQQQQPGVLGSKRPLPSELMYAGRSTPQPYQTTTTTSAGLFGYRNNGALGSNSNANNVYASPLVAQFPKNTNTNTNNIQLSVKPNINNNTTTSNNNNSIFSSNVNATSWNNNNNNGGGGPLAPMQNVNRNMTPSSSQQHGSFSKPGAFLGGNNGSTTNSNNNSFSNNNTINKTNVINNNNSVNNNNATNPRVTSKLRQMVQDAQNVSTTTSHTHNFK